MRINSKCKVVLIIGLLKTFCRQKFPVSSYRSKETVEIDFFVTTKNTK